MKTQDKFVFFLLLGFSFLITLFWFNQHKVLSGGETGFAIFNKELIGKQISVWQDTGTGWQIPFYFTRLVPVVFVAFLNLLIIPIFISQWLILFLVVASGGIGMFFLYRYFFPNYRNVFGVLAASSFYFLNLYSQSQIFGRFLYESMFSWALLPLFFLFLVKWISSKKIKWLLGFVLLTFFFSISYSQPANIVVFWFPVGLYVAFEVYRNRKTIVKVVQILIRSFVAFSVWVLMNIWWLYQYFRFSSSGSQFSSGWSSNFSSLLGVSKYFPTSQIVLLRQKFLFGDGSVFFNFYSQKWVLLLSIIVLAIFLIGVWFARKQKGWYYLTSLVLFGWFISKGTNFPFGVPFFSFLFKDIQFTQAFRNSYEKFGLVFLLPYAIFFGYGIDAVFKILSPRIRNLAVFTILFLSCGILVWPMWTGDVFPQYLKVDVPNYYLDANLFLNSKENDGRILMLPIVPGDSVHYIWGYQGVEPSEFLFDRPAVSKVLRAEHFDEKYWSLVKSFVKEGDYNKLLDEMNIKYLVLHNDLMSDASGASYSAQVRQTIAKNPQINFLKSFGDLEVYEYVGSLNPGLFVMTGKKSNLLSYQRLNSTHYIVNVQNAKEPYKLVFRETYNDLWEARINGKKIDRHFTIYDYANAWEIDQNGDYTVDVIFKVWPWE